MTPLKHIVNKICEYVSIMLIAKHQNFVYTLSKLDGRVSRASS